MFSASAQIPQPTHHHDTSTILLIENNALNTQYTELTLTSARYLVRTATSLDAGWKIIQNGGIHAVVAHLSTHDESGPAPTQTAAQSGSDPMVAFLQRLRANPATTQLPIILVTGERRREVLDKVMAAGANYLLKRPYPQQALLDRIRQCLENR